MTYKRLGHDARFTSAGAQLELLPSSLSGDAFGKKGMEYAIASDKYLRGGEGVAKELNKILAEAYAGSQARLAGVRAKMGVLGHKLKRGVVVTSQNAGRAGRIDAYLFLDDHASKTPNAMAIEMGRGSFFITDEDGNETEVGGMEGVGILHAGFARWGISLGSLSGTGGGEV